VIEKKRIRALSAGLDSGQSWRQWHVSSVERRRVMSSILEHARARDYLAAGEDQGEGSPLHVYVSK
jgi:hypothetical protein